MNIISPIPVKAGTPKLQEAEQQASSALRAYEDSPSIPRLAACLFALLILAGLRKESGNG